MMLIDDLWWVLIFDLIGKFGGFVNVLDFDIVYVNNN